MWYDTYTMKIRMTFNQNHLDVYGRKAVDFILLTIGGLIYAELAAETEVSLWVLGLGVIFVIIGFWLSYKLLKLAEGGEDDDA